MNLRIMEYEGKKYIAIERVKYGQPDQPEEKREYQLFFRESSAVGFLEDFKNIVKQVKEDNPELEGLLIFDEISTGFIKEEVI